MNLFIFFRHEFIYIRNKGQRELKRFYFADCGWSSDDVFLYLVMPPIYIYEVNAAANFGGLYE